MTVKKSFSLQQLEVNCFYFMSVTCSAPDRINWFGGHSWKSILKHASFINVCDMLFCFRQRSSTSLLLYFNACRQWRPLIQSFERSSHHWRSMGNKISKFGRHAHVISCTFSGGLNMNILWLLSLVVYWWSRMLYVKTLFKYKHSLNPSTYHQETIRLN